MEAEASLTERLSRCYSGAVYDVMRALGKGDCVLPQTIHPLDDGLTVAGPAFTMSGRFDERLDPHQTLLAWTGFLSQARAGTVIVCQPNTSSVALMGELSAETLQGRGIRGYVVDGGCRDVSFIRGIGFPVFCRFRTPRDVVGRWMPDALETPISIGGVEIAPGDFIIGDMDGVVVIPRGDAAEVIGKAEAIINTESSIRRAIRAGEDPKEAYLKYGKF